MGTLGSTTDTTNNGMLWVHPGFQARRKWKAQLQCDARVCVYHFFKFQFAGYTLYLTNAINSTKEWEMHAVRVQDSMRALMCCFHLCTTSIQNDKHNVLDCACSEAMIQNIVLHRRQQLHVLLSRGVASLSPHTQALNPSYIIHCFWFAFNASHTAGIRRAHGKGGIRRAHGKEHAVE